MEPEVRYCTTADGVRIAYTVTGSGPPLLLVVDPISSHVQLEWAHPAAGAIQREYAKRATLIRYDPRGCGLSDRVMAKSLDEMMLDVEAVVERAGFERFAVQGVLNASLPMIMYAARNPERVTRLGIADGFLRVADMLGTPQVQAFLATAKADWTLATEMVGYVSFGAGRDVNASHGEYIRACVGPESLDGTEISIGWDVIEYASQVQAPTLVVKHTGVTIVTMDMTKELVATIPNAQLLVLEGSFADDIEENSDKALTFLIGESATRERTAPAPAIPSGMTAILFADIVDSTALTERLGDAAFRAKARDLDAILRTVIRDHSGTPIEGKLLGDGVLATFASARQAIEAARACAASGDSAGLPLHLGLHAGDVIREDNNVFGGAVNIAARISGLSAPGEVLVSQTVRELARTSAGVSFGDRGEQALKGVGEPVRVWAVRGSD
jgi:class 3 adenylate cyclase